MDRYRLLVVSALKVDLPLTKYTSGSATFIRVNLWADTGEIITLEHSASGDFNLQLTSES